MSVAQTILAQLGGNRFVAMTGVKNLASDGDALVMKLARTKSKASHLKISLNSMDLYDVEWIKCTNPTKRNNFTGSRTVIKTSEGVYGDMLAELFEAETGQYTSL